MRFRLGWWWLSVCLALFAVARPAAAATVTLAAAAPNGPGNCIPFGGYSATDTYTGFVYRNVPAFRLLPGDQIRFDLGLPNDVPIVVDVDIAATTTNGGDVPVAFTSLVAAGSPSPSVGDAIANNFELAFTVTSGFDFAGGGLIVRIRPRGAFASDTNCDQVLMSGTSADGSGFFVKRVYADPDGVPPWQSEGTTDIGQVRFVTSDDDRDGVANPVDNCPSIPNPDQGDVDADGLGDTCDPDDDDDGVLDGFDNCPLVSNAEQSDVDDDGVGDVCELDFDGDGVPGGEDNCPLVGNPAQGDTDDDGEGDACDADLDGDGVENLVDNCSAAANGDQADGDGDGLGDVCDAILGEGGGGAGGDSGGGGSGAVTTGAGGDGPGSGAGAPTASAGGPGGGTGEGGGGTGEGAGPGDHGDDGAGGGPAGEGDGGCGCRVAGAPSPAPARALALVAGIAVAVRLRRRHRAVA
jgi:MYXO-CTERM domain-containing protein